MDETDGINVKNDIMEGNISDIPPWDSNTNQDFFRSVFEIGLKTSSVQYLSESISKKSKGEVSATLLARRLGQYQRFLTHHSRHNTVLRLLHRRQRPGTGVCGAQDSCGKARGKDMEQLLPSIESQFHSLDMQRALMKYLEDAIQTIKKEAKSLDKMYQKRPGGGTRGRKAMAPKSAPVGGGASRPPQHSAMAKKSAGPSGFSPAPEGNRHATASPPATSLSQAGRLMTPIPSLPANGLLQACTPVAPGHYPPALPLNQAQAMVPPAVTPDSQMGPHPAWGHGLPSHCHLPEEYVRKPGDEQKLWLASPHQTGTPLAAASPGVPAGLFGVGQSASGLNNHPTVGPSPSAAPPPSCSQSNRQQSTPSPGLPGGSFTMGPNFSPQGCAWRMVSGLPQHPTTPQIAAPPPSPVEPITEVPPEFLSLASSMPKQTGIATIPGPANTKSLPQQQNHVSVPPEHGVSLGMLPQMLESATQIWPPWQPPAPQRAHPQPQGLPVTSQQLGAVSIPPTSSTDEKSSVKDKAAKEQLLEADALKDPLKELLLSLDIPSPKNTNKGEGLWTFSPSNKYFGPDTNDSRLFAESSPSKMKLEDFETGYTPPKDAERPCYQVGSNDCLDPHGDKNLEPKATERQRGARPHLPAPAETLRQPSENENNQAVSSCSYGPTGNSLCGSTAMI